MTSEIERKAFEAWLATVMPVSKHTFSRGHDGEYAYNPAHQYWKVWQAIAAWQRTQSAGVPEGCKLVPAEPSFETRQALYNSGFEAPDNILDYAYRSVLGAVRIPVEEYSDDTRKPHELSAAGCRCVRFGEGNPHWPCELHAAKKEQADLVAVWRCRIAGSESYAYFSSKRCRFCEPLYAAPAQPAAQGVETHHINCNAVSQYPAGKCNCGKGE